MPSVAEALRQARAAAVARLDALRLLEQVTGRTRERLLAHDDEALAAGEAASWQALLRRRADGEPLAYLVGEREFHGLRLRVSPAVLVPRPETELLVQWGLEFLGAAPAATVIDLGTGSGAIALALRQCANAAGLALDVTATDASPGALEVARANADALGLEIRFAQGDWWSAVPGRCFGLALSNPPYIAEGDRHLPALRFEPRQALCSGADGLDAIRRLVADAPAHLLPGGGLLIEHGHEQADAVQSLLRRRGFAMAQTRSDLAGLPRCTGAVWQGS